MYSLHTHNDRVRHFICYLFQSIVSWERSRIEHFPPSATHFALNQQQPTQCAHSIHSRILCDMCALARICNFHFSAVRLLASTFFIFSAGPQHRAFQTYTKICKYLCFYVIRRQLYANASSSTQSTKSRGARITNSQYHWLPTITSYTSAVSTQ